MLAFLFRFNLQQMAETLLVRVTLVIMILIFCPLCHVRYFGYFKLLPIVYNIFHFQKQFFKLLHIWPTIIQQYRSPSIVHHRSSPSSSSSWRSTPHAAVQSTAHGSTLTALSRRREKTFVLKTKRDSSET